MTCDMWHVTCDTWHVTCDMWHCDILWGVNILIKFQLPSFYCFWFMIFWRFGGKGWLTDWLTEGSHPQKKSASVWIFFPKGEGGSYWNPNFWGTFSVHVWKFFKRAGRGLIPNLFRRGYLIKNFWRTFLLEFGHFFRKGGGGYLILNMMRNFILLCFSHFLTKMEEDDPNFLRNFSPCK